jgi:uncharacterized protein
MLHTLLDSVAKVRSLFSQIDQCIVEFQLKTGLRCISGCGRCCPEGDVFTTVLEMLPVAHDILCQGAADSWLARIDAQAPSPLCVFYRYDVAPGDPGHCLTYADRPAVCRLFGFAAVHNRMGGKELSVCKVLKQANPEAVQCAVQHQNEAPCFPQIGTLIYSQDPASGTRLLPINQALREALMRLGLQMQISQSEALGNTTAA